MILTLTQRLVTIKILMYLYVDSPHPTPKGTRIISSKLPLMTKCRFKIMFFNTAVRKKNHMIDLIIHKTIHGNRREYLKPQGPSHPVALGRQSMVGIVLLVR